MLNFLKRNKKPVFHTQIKHPISLSFSCGGINYYSFDDPFNTPYKRAFSALSAYEKVSMRMTPEFIKKRIEAETAIINRMKECFTVKDSALNLNSLFKGLQQLERNNYITKERMDFIIEEDTVLDLASVVYFDETENPALYDHDYAQKKIANWKKHYEPIHDFFLSQPILRLIPFLQDYKQDIQNSLQVQRKIKQYHSEVLSQLTSTNQSLTENDRNSPLHAGSLSN